MIQTPSFQTIVENIPAMLYLLDAQGRFLWCNALFTKEFGWDHESMRDVDVVAACFPDPNQRAQFLAHATSKETSAKTLLARTREGRQIFSTWTTVRLPSGECVGLCSNVDNTVRLEQENARVQERLNYILEGSGLGAWDWDLATNAVIFDNRWCKMLGLDPATTLQTLSTWADRVHPDDIGATYTDIKRYLSGETNFYENVHRMRHADGRWVYILDRGRVSAHDDTGKPLRFTGTHFDISLQKEVESELRKTKLQLEDAQSVASLGSWEFDIGTGAITWSRQMFEFFPESVEAGPPTYEGHVATIHTDDQTLFKSKIEQALVDGKPYQFRYRCVKAGRLRWLEGRGRSVCDAEGKRVGLRGTCQDVTEQVELAHSLELARQQAIETAKFSSLGEMAGGVAHEINNPLTILMGRAQQIAELLKDNEAADIQSAREAAQSLQRQIDRIARIVRGMRSFSRDGGADPLQDEVLGTVVEDTLELCQERFRNHGVLLELDVTPGIHASCRATEISQIILNLLNNSFDAVQGQPVRVVQLALTSNGTHARLSVTDTGPGVPPELESRIMEPFFTTKGVGQGTGLGLSVSRGIAQSHGARLFYERAAGKGARFVFEITLLRVDSSRPRNCA